MKVRDLSLPITEYKGRVTDARDYLCPCRPCWNAHDCGYTNSQGKWITRMECATRWNNGCPDDKEPTHVFPEGKRKCARCGKAEASK